ncbi:MAG: hypothetical protein AAGA68_02625 [Pseudomonadota bacterium]
MPRPRPASRHAAAVALPVIALLVMLPGCVSVPEDPAAARVEAARERFIAEQLSRAAAHLAGDDLPAALRSLRIAHAVSRVGGAREALGRRVEEIAGKLATRQRVLLEAAERAWQAGDRERAEREALAALALDPTHPGLRARLRSWHRRWALTRVAGRAITPPASLAVQVSARASAAHGDEEPTIPDEQAAYLKATSEASVLFNEALGLLDSDREAAAALFEQVLQRDPTHAGARAYLSVLDGTS